MTEHYPTEVNFFESEDTSIDEESSWQPDTSNDDSKTGEDKQRNCERNDDDTREESSFWGEGVHNEYDAVDCKIEEELEDILAFRFNVNIMWKKMIQDLDCASKKLKSIRLKRKTFHKVMTKKERQKKRKYN